MPIFDQGYQHWKGALSGHAWRWLAIARRGISVQLQGKLIRVLLLMSWAPALALVVALAMWGLLEQGSESILGLLRPLLPAEIAADPRVYRQAVWTLAYSTFFKFELFFIMLLVVVAGPNLISGDLRCNALPLYFSRPLSRLDYFIGKLGVIAVLVAAVAIVPGIAAYLLGVCFSLDLKVIRDTWRLLPASLVYGLLIVVSAGTLILAMSSLSRRSLYVGITWVGMWLISSTVAGALTGIQQATLYSTVWQEENARRKTELVPNMPPSDPAGRKRWEENQTASWKQRQERVEALQAELAATNWRPLCSYTANLVRLGEALLNTDAAWVEIGRAVEAPRKVIAGGFGSPFGMGLGKTPPPINERRLADQFVPQYPWLWSAGVLAGLLGLSLWILSMRVKSLDRLR